VTTEDPIVPLGDVPVAAPEGTGRGWIGIGFALVGMLILAGLIGSLFVRIDRVALKPGSARPTGGLVTINGAPTYPSDGEFAFTTVALVDRITVVDQVQDWLDDDVDTYDRSLVFEGSPEENRALNAQQMVGSKQLATKVALEYLGYTVPLHFDGLSVVKVVPRSPADGALVEGDTITVIDGERLDEDGDIVRILDPKHPGDEVTLTVEDAAGTAHTFDLTLEALQDDPASGFDADPDQGSIGVNLQPRGVEVDFPFEVVIDSGEVGGPSAGLAFTLSVIDALTEGDLTGGKRIAVTGTIAADGTVGEVGGIKQKSAAVAEAGYDVFLVPAKEVEQAEDRLGDAVEVIGVGTLRDALDALVSLGGTGLTLDAAS
jgi:PDZ domain-containing protein